MSDITFSSHPASLSFGAKKGQISAVFGVWLRTVGATMQLWHHNYRSRRQLAAMSRLQRRDLPFAGEIEAELAKPFWKK
jgi:uncharacterized protein YjiS (DUF1127 family)